MPGAPLRLWSLFFLLLPAAVSGCSHLDDFDRGDSPVEPAPPTCPEIADCGQQECGLDPICGEDCGSCEDGSTCRAEGSCCLPRTCEEIGAECGLLDDGCGGQLECGACSFGMECSPGEAEARSCTCPSAGDGGSVTIDIPSVRVLLQPSLNGAPPSEENTGAESSAAFYLQPLNGPHGVGWDRVRLDLYDSEAEKVRSELPLRVIPGDYALYYEHRGTGRSGPWPLNPRSLIHEQIGITEEQVIEVPIDTITLPVSIRIDGVDISELELAPGQGVEVGLNRPGTGLTSLARLSEADPDNGFLLEEVTILPGGYNVSYLNNMGASETPLAFGFRSDFPLGSSNDITTLSLSSDSQGIEINIESADVSLDLTLNSEAVSLTDFALADDPRLYLTPRMPGGSPSNGPSARQDHGQPSGGGGGGGGNGAPSQNLGMIELPPLWDPSSASLGLPLNLTVLDGAYDIFYGHTEPGEDVLDGQERRWPLNRGILADNRTLYDGAEVILDLPSVEVDVTASLDGVPLSPESCADGSGEITLLWAEPIPNAAWTAWPLPELCDEAAGAARTPYGLHLVAGTYSTSYRSDDRPDGWLWPEHLQPVTLSSSVDLSESQLLDIQIPVIVLSLGFTRNGELSPLSVTEPIPAGWPEVELAGLGLGPTTGMGWNLPATVRIPVVQEPRHLRVLPYNYLVSYKALTEGLGTDWPNASYKVDPAVLIETDGFLTYDLVFRRIGIAMAIDGLASSETTSSAEDHGRLALVRNEPRATFEWVASWNSEFEFPWTEQAVNLPPGEYFLLYYPPSFELPSQSSYENLPVDGRWPLSTGFRAGCILVE
ncbi:MAG: hypothetical protein VX498_08075 [Myxococcota bacterium]|nr:hypothetical protein [Myxococcota bacterium]